MIDADAPPAVAGARSSDLGQSRRHARLERVVLVAPASRHRVGDKRDGSLTLGIHAARDGRLRLEEPTVIRRALAALAVAVGVAVAGPAGQVLAGTTWS